MSIFLVEGARHRALIGTLSALGLVRVVAEQADPAVRCSFIDGALKIESKVEDIAGWLADEYVPTPVLSPWNEGSGFGTKDKEPRKALAELLALPTARVDPFRRSFSAVESVAVAARTHRWDKPRVVRETRNVCPDAMVRWMDSAVVMLSADKVAFPPLLGSGGNDGHLDFSTNFHQRLLEVLPSGSVSRAHAAGLARAWLAGTSAERLSKAAVGQFDPGAAGTPNSSPYGGAESIVNPWAYVLMVEGAMMFSAAPARKLSSQAVSTPRAAMTFTTFGSQHGSAAGSALEESRGEVWIPWWTRALSFAEIRAIFAEGRAVWRGHTATQPDQMYLAAASRSVAPGVAGFDRYQIVKRNGRSFSAVLGDAVMVRMNTALALVAALEDWPNQAARLNDSPATVRQTVSDFAAARIALAKAPSASGEISAARTLLSARTAMEGAVARSASVCRKLKPGRPPKAAVLVDLLAQPGWRDLLERREFRLAVGLASVITGPIAGHPRGRTMRELLTAVDPPENGDRSSAGNWRASPLVPGLSVRPVDLLISEVARWLSVAPAEPAGPISTDGPGAAGGVGAIRGFVAPMRGVRVPAADLHAWVRGDVFEPELDEWLFALLALDWRGVTLTFPEVELGVVDPSLSLLAPFRDGIGSHGDSVDAADNSTRYGLTSTWITQLCAGKTTEAQESVRRRLGQLGYSSARMTSHPGGWHRPARRLVASLIPRSTSTYPAFRRCAQPTRDTDEFEGFRHGAAAEQPSGENIQPQISPTEEIT